MKRRERILRRVSPLPPEGSFKTQTTRIAPIKEREEELHAKARFEGSTVNAWASSMGFGLNSMNDNAWKESVRSQLDIGIFPPGTPCPGCGVELDKHGNHGYACPKEAIRTRFRNSQHSHVNRQLDQIAKACVTVKNGFQTRIEPDLQNFNFIPKTTDNKNKNNVVIKNRGDLAIWLTGYDYDSIIIDTTLTHSTCDRSEKAMRKGDNIVFTQKNSTQQAIADKVKLYTKLYNFLPSRLKIFALTTSGILADDAIGVLKYLAKISEGKVELEMLYQFVSSAVQVSRAKNISFLRHKLLTAPWIPGSVPVVPAGARKKQRQQLMFDQKKQLESRLSLTPTSHSLPPPPAYPCPPLPLL